MPIDHSFKRNLGVKLTAWLKCKKPQNYLNHANEFEYEAIFVNAFQNLDLHFDSPNS